MLERVKKATALLYGGGMAERRVVADKGPVIVICTEAEYTAALEEGRDPDGVGFPREDIVIDPELASKSI